MEDAGSRSDIETLQTFLEQNNNEVVLIRFQWVDYSGIIRARLLTVQRCLSIARGTSTYGLGGGMAGAVSALPTGRPYIPHARKLVPDWSSLTRCRFAPKHALVMCSHICDDFPLLDEQCPRRLLERVLNTWRDLGGYSLRLGFEVEFSLVSDNLPVAPSSDGTAGWSTTSRLHDKTLKFVDTVVEDLIAAGIGVHHFHTELSDQLEIALEHETPMKAIDQFYYAQESIRKTAVLCGVKASLFPKPFPDEKKGLNGCHMHLSIGEHPNPDLFLAGVMNRLRGLCAIGMPSPDSYSRTRPDAQNAGCFVGFGTQNRYVPIRKITGNHWELRCVDSTANMYMLTALILASGMQGLQEQEPLRWRDLDMHPKLLSKDELRKAGIKEMMPSKLAEALDALQEDDFLGRTMGQEMLAAYVAAKRTDIAAAEKLTDEERCQMYLQYF